MRDTGDPPRIKSQPIPAEVLARFQAAGTARPGGT